MNEYKDTLRRLRECCRMDVQGKKFKSLTWFDPIKGGITATGRFGKKSVTVSVMKSGEPIKVFTGNQARTLASLGRLLKKGN